MKKEFDAVIIGGGASGLVCAIRAKQKNSGLKIAVIEKNDRIGKKLLSTGNGRCNLTNSGISAKKYTGSFKQQSKAVFAKYPAEAVLNFFEELGLLTKADSEGRYYPLCRQASAVLDVLRFALERLGVELFCGETITSIKSSDKYKITTQNGELTAKKLVIACGSKAAPKLGGSASALDYLKNLGHKTIPFSPALCPILTDSEIIRSLKGLRLAGRVSLFRGDDIIKSETGEIQFNEDSLSGICVFNLSLFAKKGDVIAVDALPDYSEFVIYSILLKNRVLFSNLSADNLMSGIFQKRISQAILKLSGIKSFSSACGELNDKTLREIARRIKRLEFPVSGISGFERAQCSRGGALGTETDENTMRSRLVKNLYICGEAVDICGECGGYNLHFAFASGLIAGENL